MLLLSYSRIPWIRSKAVKKSAKTFTPSEMLMDNVILKIPISDKTTKVLYEVSSVPKAAMVTKEIKAATGVQEKLRDAKVACIMAFHLISLSSWLRENNP